MTQSLLQKLFTYKDGHLYWKLKISDKINVGNKAGNKSGKYETIKINKKNYYSHRLIFLYFFGYLPIEIDHINNNYRDNNISNLRASDSTKNKYNIKKHKTSSSQFKGITFDKRKNKWMARIKTVDKRLFLGYYNTEELAAKAYDIAALKYFKKFANINGVKL